MKDAVESIDEVVARIRGKGREMILELFEPKDRGLIVVEEAKNIVQLANFIMTNKTGCIYCTEGRESHMVHGSRKYLESSYKYCPECGKKLK